MIFARTLAFKLLRVRQLCRLEIKYIGGTMLHPNTELRFVNEEIGYGVFATAAIPKGTIVYVKDCLEIEITEDRFHNMDIACKNIVEKYSYIDERGVRIVSWDHAKYVNHRCDCNSMSTGYGFEIAIRNIEEGEEITDEYGLFNIPSPIEVNCGCAACRRTLLPTDIDRFYRDWDIKIQEAFRCLKEVPQPLLHLMDNESVSDLLNYLSGKSRYRSVRKLKYRRSKRGYRAKASRSQSIENINVECSPA